MTNTITPEATQAQDLYELGKRIYDMDPDWTWDRDQVQRFIPYEKLPAARILQLTNAARGFEAFADAFERDIPLSGLMELFKAVNRFSATVDTES
jgi:hypothetical protein